MASIRKRVWTSRGTKREAWVCDYFDQAGQRHLKTFATKKAADAWSVTTQHEVKLGTHTATSASITVAEAFERWIADCKANGLERSTIEQRQTHLKLHVAPFIGREKLSALTAPRVYQFDAQLRDAGRSVAMRKKIITNLKTCLSFAQGVGLVAQNVAASVRVKTDSRSKPAPLKAGVDFPSQADIRLILDNAPAPKWRAFFAVAIFCGLRF